MKVKNYRNFQHYKHRNPPWIRLHKDILERRAITLLADRYHRVLIGLWLLASEDPLLEGNLPDIDDIAFRLRLEKDQVINALQNLTEFIEFDASEALAVRLQDAVPETETEAEAEAESTLSSSRRKLNKKPPTLKNDAVQVLEFLNQKCGRSYRPTEANLDFITARMREGYTVQDMIRVVIDRYNRWHGDDEMRDYLRPATLFNKTKFAQYVGELPAFMTGQSHGHQ